MSIFIFALGIIPLLKANITFKRAMRQVLIVEILSIAFMETAEVLIEVNTAGVMGAGLTNPLFWGAVFLALTAGFITAFPVDYIKIGKGV